LFTVRSPLLFTLPWEANPKTPRRTLWPQSPSMIHPMMTFPGLSKENRRLTLGSLKVNENVSRPQSKEVLVRSKAGDIMRMLTLSNYLDNDAAEKKLERLARLEKENKKMKVKLLKASKEAAKSRFIS
jgi:hypothetical protein